MNMIEEDIETILPSRDSKTIICWEHYFASGSYKQGNIWLHWRTWEKIVRIYLEAYGWSDIFFYSIDSDSFGPLVRGMRAIDPSGQKRLFSYG